MLLPLTLILRFGSAQMAQIFLYNLCAHKDNRSISMIIIVCVIAIKKKKKLFNQDHVCV